MSTVSSRFINNIINYITDTSGSTNRKIRSLDINNNKVYTEFLEFDVNSPEKYEVPIICDYFVATHLVNIKYYGMDFTSSKFVFPLFIAESTITSNSAASAIQKAFKLDVNTRLAKIILKEKVYYGGKGILLDSDKKLLLLITTTKSFSHNIDPEIHCYVSPEVFINNTDSMNKAIIKNIIPALMISTQFRDNRQERCGVKVVVTDFIKDNTWIFNTIPPDSIDFNSEIHNLINDVNFEFK